MAERSLQETILVYLLRIGGSVTLLALLAVVMPVDWMAGTHRRLGLGEFPSSTIVDYLTRSVSMLYAIHGGLLLVVSTNVRRYAGMVTYLAAVNVIFGAALIGIDLHAGMPTFWTLSEGPPLFVIGILMFYLLRAVPRE